MAGQQAAVAGDPVVEHQADLDRQRAAAGRTARQAEEADRPVHHSGEQRVDRDRGRQRPYHMRRVGQQRVALAQRFPHQLELAVFQVAQPAMDHARRRGAAARAEVVALDQQHAQALQRQFAVHADAVDAAAHDDDVERAVAAHPVQVLLSLFGHRSAVRRLRGGACEVSVIGWRSAVEVGQMAAARPRLWRRSRSTKAGCARRRRSRAPGRDCARRTVRR